MSYYFEKIPLLADASFIIRDFEVPFFDFPQHYHPEYELIWVSNSSGTRLVGDSIEKFTDGDLVLLGPNLPHQWKTDFQYTQEEGLARQVVLHLHQHFLGEELLNRKECSQLKELLQQSAYGLLFEGNIVEKVSKLLKELLRAHEGLGSIILLLEMMKVLANSEEKRMLSSQAFRTSPSQPDDKINPIFQYLYNHFQEEVTLGSISERFHMSPSAFGHYIRKKTGKTFTRLLNELRIGYACKNLAQTDLNISQICYQSGFNNLSYFNRKFLEIKKMTPAQFRKNIK